MNRFILFDAGDTFEGYNDRRETTFPKRISDAAARFRELPLPLEDRPQRSILIEHDAFLLFREFRDYAAKRCAGGESIDTLWGRANQNALILAGILAVGVDHKKPRITITEAKWAIAFIRWSIVTWGRRLEGSVSRNFTEGNSKKLESLIRDCSKFVPKVKKKVWANLLRQGYMPRSFLMQKCRHLRGSEFKDALDALVTSGLVGEGETDTGLEFYKWVGE
jgi:hypothetical protein